jgi:hypothetical protein
MKLKSSNKFGLDKELMDGKGVRVSVRLCFFTPVSRVFFSSNRGDFIKMHLIGHIRQNLRK